LGTSRVRGAERVERLVVDGRRGAESAMREGADFVA
jgi:hypothetical protein